jgi:hypothetical protein
MRLPFILAAGFVVAGAIAHAQVATSPTQLVRPALKNVNQRYGQSKSQPPASQPSPCPPGAVAAQSSQPASIIAKIEPGLAPSKLSIIGTVNGLKGILYVTNTGVLNVTPSVELVICDQKGFKIGSTSLTGEALTPNADEKFVFLATNLNATDLKLNRLAVAPPK